ncbi:hypothetical protein PaG_01592 [Moesziomyces aphidis]|uniref:Uncharacterized protein n=1 Tax=Moesziomyces aphidis TaxID=84754 RepID=W3VPB5_MOEAP|nr:hypothetical protein PaG_01592 [Moesziomyces aphidis]
MHLRQPNPDHHPGPERLGLCGKREICTSSLVESGGIGRRRQLDAVKASARSSRRKGVRRIKLDIAKAIRLSTLNQMAVDKAAYAAQRSLPVMDAMHEQERFSSKSFELRHVQKAKQGFCGPLGSGSPPPPAGIASSEH